MSDVPPSEPVSKEQLIDVAWRGLVVEESNLTVQIGALRRALGEEPGGGRWIETLPRRGYRFVGPAPTIERHSPDPRVLVGQKTARKSALCSTIVSSSS